MADLATSPFSTTLSDTLTIRTGLAGRRAVPRRLNVTHSQHADSAQQIYSSTVSALAVFLAMNRPYSRPGDLHRVTTPIAEYGAEEGDCGRIATASLCAGVSVAGYAARTTPSTGGLGLGAGIGEQVLGCVGNLGHSDASDDRGWTSAVVGDAQPTVKRSRWIKPSFGAEGGR